MSDKFVYVTYIRTTPEKLWDALLKPEFVKQWFWGTQLQSDWKKDSAWKMVMPDGTLNTTGNVLEIDPPRRLVLSWVTVSEFKAELAAEGPSQATFELEKMGDNVKLTLTHEIARDNSKLIKAVSGGWPMLLANIKSLLETGKPITDPRLVEGCSSDKAASCGG